MSAVALPVKADDSVRALQHALYRAAKADPGRRFHALRDKIYRRDVLWRAWVAVRRNDGAPGIDATTLADVEEYGVARLLEEVACELWEGMYRPLPTRRVWIPKPGSTERRPLSIPAVRDRIVQAATKIVLEPVFEADFLGCSFGFRPKRSPHDALQVMIDEAWRGRRWVVETDIANCFSAIPSQGLMQAVEERVSDRAVLKLLRAMLHAGVMDDGQVRQEAGTSQGALCAAAHNPPCGVPVGVSFSSPSSVRIPAFRNALIRASTRLSLTRARTRSMSAVWSMVSKEAPSYYPYRGPRGGAACVRGGRVPSGGGR
jgi:RNA-directed DNA polymerase